MEISKAVYASFHLYARTVMAVLGFIPYSIWRALCADCLYSRMTDNGGYDMLDGRYGFPDVYHAMVWNTIFVAILIPILRKLSFINVSDEVLVGAIFMTLVLSCIILLHLNALAHRIRAKRRL